MKQDHQIETNNRQQFLSQIAAAVGNKIPESGMGMSTTKTVVVKIHVGLEHDRILAPRYKADIAMQE